MNRPLTVGIGIAVVAVIVAAGVRRVRSGGGPERDEEAATVVAVHVVPIARATLHEYVDTWGTVEPEPPSSRRGPASARIAAPVGGLLAQVRCAEGERVPQGATLFLIDPRVGDVAVSRARQALKFAQVAFERQKALGPGEATSQKLYQEAEQNLADARNDLANAEAQRALLDVRAPLAGTVVKVNARPGEAVDPATILAEIMDLDRLVVAASVRSGDAPRIHSGQSAHLTTRGSTSTGGPGGNTASGTVSYVGDAVDSKTDTVTVRIALPAGVRLRPGQFMDVRLLTAEHRDRLVVPVEGLVVEEGEPSIAVVEGDKAVKRRVKPGVREGTLVAVEGEGLREGQMVVAAGAYGLPHESRIRVIGH